MRTEDRWIIGSLILSFIGVVSAALLKDPRPIGISVFVIVPLLILVSSEKYQRTFRIRLRELTGQTILPVRISKL